MILFVLAAYRVTRLITRDQMPLIAVPRDAFAQRWAVYENVEDKRTSIGGKRTNLVMRSLAYLWECDWCMSVWVCAGMAICHSHWMNESWWQLTLLAAASSGVTGLIAQREPE